VRRGRLIAFEGGEASGKSTQAAVLAERLGALLTREPGGTALGIRVRALVLDPNAVGPHPRAEALLLAADRAQHVAEVVAPALAAGRDVVTDRFSGSTLAYQGYGQGLPVDDLVWLSRWASDGVEPDLVVLLDVEPVVATGRQGGRPLDRLEARDAGFHGRVRDGYRALAQADPQRWVVVQGTGSENEVAARVWEAYSAWAAEDER
jgi:dTMP kinase